MALTAAQVKDLIAKVRHTGQEQIVYYVGYDTDHVYKLWITERTRGQPDGAGFFIGLQQRNQTNHVAGMIRECTARPDNLFTNLWLALAEAARKGKGKQISIWGQ